MKFETSFKYHNRAEKPEYVCKKYGEILGGRILDVGGDKCGLRPLLPEGTDYIGIGIGDGVDVELDFEKNKLPYRDNEFDCVLCLDVLEHLDNIHAVFDECCRVSCGYLIISLPNPWKDFIRMLRHGYYRGGTHPMKYYNLPPERPEDRHKWFFSPQEAETFLSERGKKNNMEVVQIDYGRGGKAGKNILKRMVYRMFFHRDIDLDNLFRGTQWSVLRKIETPAAD